jgi:[ribosomal protein S18]-alanine N-acetyltransferase
VRRTGRAAVKLRRARRNDLDGLEALERESFGSGRLADHLISRASLRRFLASRRNTFIVAEIAERLSGYVLVLYRSNSPLTRMYSIAVAGHARRGGLARMLIAAAEKNAVARGCRAMRLEVRADHGGAIRLYETSGYRRYGRRPRYYGGRVDAILLEKALGKEPRHHS